MLDYAIDLDNRQFAEVNPFWLVPSIFVGTSIVGKGVDPTWTTNGPVPEIET